MEAQAKPLTQSYTPGLILSCTNCYNQYRTECINTILTELPSYCPYCGTQTVVRGIDSTLDYWYAMAEAFNLPVNQEGVSLIKEIYDEWPRDTYRRFRDYFEAIMQTNTEQVLVEAD